MEAACNVTFTSSKALDLSRPGFAGESPGKPERFNG